MHKLRKLFADMSSVRNISLRRFIFLFTLSIAFIAAFIRKVNPETTLFRHRAIGNAILNGIDTRVYISSFYVCVIIFFAVFWIGNLLLNQLKKISSNRELDYEYSLVSDFSFIALINMVIVLHDTLQSRAVPVIPYIMFAAFAFVIFHAVLNMILPESFIVNDSEEDKRLWTCVIFLLPAFLTYFAHLMMIYSRSNIAAIKSPVTLVLYAVFYMLARLFIRSKSAVNVSANALVPLSFLPVTYIIANEIQYTLTKHGAETNPIQLAVIFSAVIIFFALVVLFGRKDLSTNKSMARIENIVLPVLLVAFALFATHTHTVTPGFDYLHDGNGVVPAQQLYEFGAIPTVDYWAPQFWPVGAYIYELLNGYNFFEITIGNVLLDAILTSLLCYFVLRKFTGGTFAALLMCFTPMSSYVSLYYCSGLLPLLYLDKMIRNKRVRDYAAITVLSLLTFALMPSSGKVAILTSIVMMILSCTNRKDLMNAAKGFLGVMFVSGAIYFLLVILRGESISDRMKLIQSFADCDIEIGPYWAFISPRNTPFEIMTCYGLLPIVSIIGLIFTLRIKDKSSVHYALIYVLIASIVAYLRVFGRHSLLEWNQTLFFPFMFCVLPMAFIHNKAFRKYALLLVMFLLVFIPYANSEKGAALLNGNHGIADAGVRNFEFVTWKPGDIRCDTTGNIAYPRDLRKVLDSTLKENQTFFDGINAHLLYALTEKEAPFVHHSVQLIYNEPGQEAYIHQFERDYENGRIPIAIMYHIPEEELDTQEHFSDVIDGIPLELSLYKIHEFINTHYDTWLIADRFCLMKAKNSNIDYEIPEGTDNIIPYGTIEQDTTMWLLPLIWANYDAKIKANFPAELQTVAQSVELESNIAQTFKLDPNIDRSDGNYLYFRITAGEKVLSSENYQDNYESKKGLYLRANMKSSAQITISYADGKAKSSFLAVPGTHDYLVRISCQYEWMNGKPNEITVSSTAPITLEKFSVLKGD